MTETENDGAASAPADTSRQAEEGSCFYDWLETLYDMSEESPNE